MACRPCANCSTTWIPLRRGADGHPDAGNGWPEATRRLRRHAARRPAADHRRRRTPWTASANVAVPPGWTISSPPIDPGIPAAEAARWRPAHAGKRASRTPEKTLHVFQLRIAGTARHRQGRCILRRMMKSGRRSTKRCCATSTAASRRDGSHPRRHRQRRPGYRVEHRAHSKGLAGIHRRLGTAAGGQGAGTALRERDAGL